MGRQGTPRSDAPRTGMLRRAGAYASAHRQRRRWYGVVGVLAAVVACVTALALSLPASTITGAATLPEGAQVPEGYTRQYSAEDPTSGVAVAVHAADGVVPEGAELKVSLLGQDTSEYAAAEQELAVQAKSEGESDYGFAALDIRFEDAEGNEVEPAGDVYVVIDADGILPEGVDPESVTVQHHAEKDEGVVVEAVADAVDATDGVVAAEDAGVRAAFTVDGFSTFTITWQKALVEENLNDTYSELAATDVRAESDGTNLLTEDFTGSQPVNPESWTFVGSAGLTAAEPGSSYYCDDHEGLNGDGFMYRDPDYIGSEHGAGFLLLTDVADGRSGTVLYNEPVQSRLGLDISFYQYQFGGDGADGIGFYLVDGSAELSEDTMGPVGDNVGGAFGYAAYDTGNGTVPGIPNGVLAVGIDAYGTFSATNQAGGTDSHYCSEHSGNNESATRHKNSVTLRGAGEQENGQWTKGYKRLYTEGVGADYVRTSKPTQDRSGNNAEGQAGGTLVHIVISPADDSGKQTITVTLTNSSGNSTTPINGVTLEETLPPLVKFGFTASTGQSNDAHFIRGLKASTVKPAEPGLMLTKAVNHDVSQGGVATDKTTFSAGEQVPYMFVVRNTGTKTLTEVSISDPLITGVHLEGSSQTSTTLEPGEQAVFYGFLTLSDEQAYEGRLTNTATAIGWSEGEQVTDTDSETIITVIPEEPVEPLGEPEHSKKIGDNGDGTYTLALDVIGATKTSGGQTVTPVDVVMIVDRSSSMNEMISSTSEAGYMQVDADDVVESHGHFNYTLGILSDATQTSRPDEIYFVFIDGEYKQVQENTETVGDYTPITNRYVSYQEHVNWTIVGTSTQVDPAQNLFYVWRDGSTSAISRMEAVKRAAEGFVNSAASSEGASQIRIGVVSFAGVDSSQDTSTIDLELTNVQNGSQDIKDAIAGIYAPGSNAGTYPDDAFGDAYSMFESSVNGAKKVVIFFTDGGPGGGSDYWGSWDINNDTANDAIAAAKPLKTELGATVYSVGVLDNADPTASIEGVIDNSAEITRINAFMHAVSSNYPSAVGFEWDRIGSRAQGGDYYKVAGDASELNEIFQGIFEDTTKTAAYTNVSIVDELSQYAEVDSNTVKWDDSNSSDYGYLVTEGVELVVRDADGNLVSGETGGYPSDVKFYYAPATEESTNTTGTVRAVFGTEYALADGWTYTLRFKVVPTDTAYTEYLTSGYSDVRGDGGTDLYIDVESTPDGGKPNTSAGKPGFHSNKNAYVSYEANGASSTANYKHPVLQVEGVPVTIPGIIETKSVQGGSAQPDTFNFTVQTIGETAAEAAQIAGWTNEDSYDEDTHTYTFSNGIALSPSNVQGQNSAIRTRETGLTFTLANVGKTYTFVYGENPTEGWTQVSTDSDSTVKAWKIEIAVSEDAASHAVRAQVKVYEGDSTSTSKWVEKSSETYVAGCSVGTPITLPFENYASSAVELPSTGGPGTTIATIGGIALVAAAGCGYGLRRSRERRGARS